MSFAFFRRLLRSLRSEDRTHALHFRKGDNHAVLLHKLRVVIIPDGPGWTAQGVEIDYAASGETVEEVQRRFETGLAKTIRAHLEKWNSIERLLKHTPHNELEQLTGRHIWAFADCTIHSAPEIEKSLPYNGIAYLRAV